MKYSLLDDWSYNRVMLQLLGAAGAKLAYGSKSIKVEIRAKYYCVNFSRISTYYIAISIT